MAGGGEPAVEIEGGADQRQVRERLREVAEVLCLGAELFAVQPEVIGVAEHLLEDEARLVQVAHARQALDIPEGAHREDRKSTRLNSSHRCISYAVFCFKT